LNQEASVLSQLKTGLTNGYKLAVRNTVSVSKRNFHTVKPSKNANLKAVLQSSKIEGPTKGAENHLVYTGCPEIDLDPLALSKVSKNLALKNITTDFSQPIQQLGALKFRQLICSPKLHLMEWLLSFPFGSAIEVLSVTDGAVARLMNSDPVKLSRVTTKQVDPEGSPAEVTTYWDMEDIHAVFTSKPTFTPSGMVMTYFQAQTLVDMGGKSHMLPGTVNHGRVIDLESSQVSIMEYRLGMGGGSLNGGVLNNLVGYLTWKAQFSAMEQMHLHPEFWKFAADFCECTSPQELSTLLAQYKNKWSAKPQLIGFLNRLADPVRYTLTAYAHLRGVSREGSVQDKYFLKNPRK
jgi:hypothetical protein